MVATLFQQDGLQQVRSPQVRVPLANRPLPPSERDLGVYEAVVVECESTRTAAERFDLSQTRIVQIRDRVIDWIATNVPPTPRLAPRQRLQLAADIAQRRTQFFLSEAMEAWRMSKGTQTRTREHADGSTTTYTQESHGDLRYLLALSRLNEQSMRLLGLEQGVARGLAHVAQASPAGSADPAEPDHPVGACSLEGAFQLQQPAARDESSEATSEDDATYDDRAERRRAFLAGEADDSSPVHEPLEEPLDEPLDEPDESPADVDLSVLPLAACGASLADRLDARPAPLGQRPMSRKQRRARRRLLEKLRRKAK